MERIARVIGDTNEGLTGSEIGRHLVQYGLKDVSPNLTKWKRLYDAFAYNQNTNQYSDYILHFICNVINPSRYPDSEKFEKQDYR